MSIRAAGVKTARILQQIGVYTFAMLAAVMLIYTILSIADVTP